MKEATNMLWRSHRNAFMTGVESVKGGGGRVLYPRSGVRWGSGVRVQHPGKNRSPRQSILDFMTVFFTVGQNAYHNGGKQSPTDQPERNGNRVQYPSYLSAGVRFQLQGPGIVAGK
jgi:hypothetical protein